MHIHPLGMLLFLFNEKYPWDYWSPKVNTSVKPLMLDRMNSGLDCFILKQMFPVFFFIFRICWFHSSKEWGTNPPNCQEWNRLSHRLQMLSFKHRKNEGKKKGTFNADLESAQQASSLLFKECVAYTGKFSSFSHRNSCNQCEVAVSPKDNKSSEHHEEIRVNVKNLHLSPVCLILSKFVHYCNNWQRFGFIFCFGGRRKLM